MAKDGKPNFRFEDLNLGWLPVSQAHCSNEGGGSDRENITRQELPTNLANIENIPNVNNEEATTSMDKYMFLPIYKFDEHQNVALDSFIKYSVKDQTTLNNLVKESKIFAVNASGTNTLTNKGLANLCYYHNFLTADNEAAANTKSNSLFSNVPNQNMPNEQIPQQESAGITLFNNVDPSINSGANFLHNNSRSSRIWQASKAQNLIPASVQTCTGNFPHVCTTSNSTANGLRSMMDIDKNNFNMNNFGQHENITPVAGTTFSNCLNEMSSNLRSGETEAETSFLNDSASDFMCNGFPLSRNDDSLVFPENNSNSQRPGKTSKTNDYINQKQICRFCFKNGEPFEIYTTHTIKTLGGRVTCPILRKYICEFCGATGDNAHTRRYCPQFPHNTSELPAYRRLPDGSIAVRHGNK